jgi:hypothetical protein
MTIHAVHFNVINANTFVNSGVLEFEPGQLWLPIRLLPIRRWMFVKVNAGRYP